MKVYDMPQKSEEWFKIKYGKVGGSSAYKLTTDAKFKILKFELISAKLEEFEMPEEKWLSNDVDRGNEYEPYARQYLEELKGLEFKECGWLQSDIPILGLSPDGLTASHSQSAEFKCPSRAVHTEYILGGKKIPTKYFWQNIAYFAVNPQLKEHHFMSYRPESRIQAHIITLTPETVTQFGNSKKTVSDWVKTLREKATIMNKLVDDEVAKLTAREAF